MKNQAAFENDEKISALLVERQGIGLTTNHRFFKGYMIFSDGDIWGVKRGRYKKPYIKGDKGVFIQVCENGKYGEYSLARTILALFTDVLPASGHVHFKNGNALDVRLDNIEIRVPERKVKFDGEKYTYYQKKGKDLTLINNKIALNPNLQAKEHKGLTVFSDGTVFNKWGAQVHTKQINLNGRKVSVRNIVAEAFIPKPAEASCVICKDGNSDNLSVSNLAWSAEARKSTIGQINIKTIDQKLSLSPVSNFKTIGGYKVFADGEIYDPAGLLLPNHISKITDGVGFTCTSRIKGNRVNVKYLVAHLFVENPNLYQYVQCIDGDSKNVSASNLVWVERPTTTHRSLTEDKLKDITSNVCYENLCENERVIFDFLNGDKSAIINWCWKNKDLLLLKIRCEMNERRYCEKHLDIFHDVVVAFERKVLKGAYIPEEGILNHKIIGWMSRTIQWLIKDHYRKTKRTIYVPDYASLDLPWNNIESRFPQLDHIF